MQLPYCWPLRRPSTCCAFRNPCEKTLCAKTGCANQLPVAHAGADGAKDVCGTASCAQAGMCPIRWPTRPITSKKLMYTIKRPRGLNNPGAIENTTANARGPAASKCIPHVARSPLRITGASNAKCKLAI